MCSLCDVLQGNGGGPSGLQEDPDSEFVTRVWVWVWVHGYSKPLILSILFGCRSRLGGGGLMGVRFVYVWSEWSEKW